MERIFRLDPKPMPRSIYIITGAIFMFNGGLAIYSNAFNPFGMIAGILMVLVGLWYIFFLSPTNPPRLNKLHPRITINDSRIKAKTGHFSRPSIMDWKEIKEIELDTYKLHFKLNKITETIRYDSTPEISINIKNAIREVSESKGIPVIGG